MLIGSAYIASSITTKMSTLQAAAPIPAFMASSMPWRWRRADPAVVAASVFEGIGVTRVQNGCSTLSTGKLAMSVLESRPEMSILTFPGAAPADCPLPLAQTEPAMAIIAIAATAKV